jgi:hypothetical protein
VVTGSFTSPGIDDNATSTAITIDSNENVGIGTNAPSAFGGKVVTVGSQTTGGSTYGVYSNNAINQFLKIGINGDQAEITWDDGDFLALGTRPDSASTASLTEYMRITSTGNVGINEPSPSTNLQVSSPTGGNAYLEVARKNSNASAVRIAAENGLTGLYSQGDEPLWFGVNSTERMRIDSTGNVGINQLNPQEKLDVIGTGSFTGMKIGGNGTDINSTFLGANSIMTFRNNGVEHMRIDSSGNVGIGETAPSSSYVVKFAHVTDPTSAGYLCENSTAKWSTYVNTSGAYDIRNETSGNLAMRIDASGNVGIGTDAPAQLLSVGDSDVVSTNYIRMNQRTPTAAATYGGLEFFYDNTAGITGVNAAIRYASGAARNDGELTFYTGSSGSTSEAMRISSSGKVGIGVNNPTRVLQTDGTQVDFSRNGRTIELNPNAGNANTHSTILVDSGMGLSVDIQGFGEAMRVSNGGNLLVGATSPAQVTSGSVNGCYLSGSADTSFSRSTTNNRGQIAFYNPNGLVGQITTSGNTTNYAEQSDERLKENVVDAPAGNIDSIKVRSFDWKSDGEHQEYGFIAQELETVAPYAVSKGETDEDMWAVDYSKLVPMLVKEIQDLKAEVAALKGA